jgi:hypothetical protein
MIIARSSPTRARRLVRTRCRRLLRRTQPGCSFLSSSQRLARSAEAPGSRLATSRSHTGDSRRMSGSTAIERSRYSCRGV